MCSSWAIAKRGKSTRGFTANVGPGKPHFFRIVLTDESVDEHQRGGVIGGVALKEP
jgi:hypothetical protein